MNNILHYPLIPEYIMIFLTLLCVFCGFFLDKSKQALLNNLVSFALFLVISSFALVGEPRSVFYNVFSCDNFINLFRILIVIGTFITVKLVKPYIPQFGRSCSDFYTLLLLASLGGMFLVGSNDLIMIFVALETLSLSSYALVGFTKKDKSSNEASLKYLVIGAASSGVMLYGFSLLYGITGETNFSEISKYLILYKSNLLLAISFIFILGGLSYKIATVPFHTWAPDVYEGAPIPVAAFLSVVSKIAAFGIIIRLLSLLFLNSSIWFALLALISVLTMTIGNLMALNQTNVKRLMAYSSISQSGYLIAGLLIGTQLGVAGMIYYLIVYLFANFGAWAVLEKFINKTGSDLIESFNGFGYKYYFPSMTLTLCLLSLAGIPIAAGFFSKFYLFYALYKSGPHFLWILFAVLLNTLISLAYYLKIIKALYLKPFSDVLIDNNSHLCKLNFVFILCFLAVLLLGIGANSFINLSMTTAYNIFH